MALSDAAAVARTAAQEVSRRLGWEPMAKPATAVAGALVKPGVLTAADMVAMVALPLLLVRQSFVLAVAAMGIRGQALLVGMAVVARALPMKGTRLLAQQTPGAVAVEASTVVVLVVADWLYSE